MGSFISKEMTGGDGGCPKTCFQVFLQGNTLQQASQAKKKTVAFIFFSQCYSGKCNIFYIYYFSANFAGSVAHGTRSIQPSFSLHHPTLCWTHRYRTLYQLSMAHFHYHRYLKARISRESSPVGS